MKSYSILNDELDKALNEKEQIEKKLIDILDPILMITEIHKNLLSPIIPVNVEAVPINKIKERLILLKEIVEFSKLPQYEKNNIIVTIEMVYKEVHLLNKEEIDRKITELLVLINQRKRFLELNYFELKKINEKIKLLSTEENYNYEFEKLKRQKKEMISDKDLMEDLKILYDYENVDEINEEIPVINNSEDLYKLVDLSIRKQINEVLRYKYIKAQKIEEINSRLKESTKGFVDSYILNNNILNNIEEFKIILNSILKGELEEYLEIKNKLGVEYVNANDNNKSKIITVKEVVEGDYKCFENSTINKYATILELSQVDEKNFDVVRDFVISMGPEFVPIFDNLWIQEDVKNRTKILELKRKQAKIKIELENSVDYY